MIKKPVGWFKRLLYKFLNESPVQYGFVASSRTVIRDVSNGGGVLGWYGEDVWKYVLTQLQPHLSKGLTLYYELVGFLPETGGAIQTGYDYGCAEKTCAVYIYRITQTNVDGDVFEFSTQQIKEWCREHGLQAVPELFYGKAKDFCPDVPTNDENDWRKAFFEKLRTSFYMERNDPLCANKVPFEGIVLRIERLNIEVYKLKADAFYELETKNLDKGDIGLDDETTA